LGRTKPPIYKDYKDRIGSIDGIVVPFSKNPQDIDSSYFRELRFALASSVNRLS